MPRPSLLLVFGGRSPEHDVSVRSARAVASAAAANFDVVPVCIGRDGKWRLDESVLPQAARRGRHGVRLLPPEPTHHLLTRGGKRAERVDVVFPIVHGTFGEDGCLQGLLELADLPYVGCGVLGSAIGMDKAVQKRLVAQAGIPTAPFVAVTPEGWADQSTRRAVARLGRTVFVKPNNGGSSVGVTRVASVSGIAKALRLAWRYDRTALVEKAVTRPREIECAVLGHGRLRVSQPGEIIHASAFYDYETKYGDSGARVALPAELSAEMTAKVRRLTGEAARVLGVSGLARADFLVDGRTGEVYFSEINTLPGFTSASLYPRLWAREGLDFTRLVEELVGAALAAHQEKGARNYERT